jgi:hypothetical protein
MDECMAYFRRAVCDPASVVPWSEWWASNSAVVESVFPLSDFVRLKHRKLLGARQMLQRAGEFPEDFVPRIHLRLEDARTAASAPRILVVPAADTFHAHAVEHCCSTTASFPLRRRKIPPTPSPFMRYRLRTLMVLLAVLPPLLGSGYVAWVGYVAWREQRDAVRAALIAPAPADEFGFQLDQGNFEIDMSLGGDGQAQD